MQYKKPPKEASPLDPTLCRRQVHSFVMKPCVPQQEKPLQSREQVWEMNQLGKLRESGEVVLHRSLSKVT